MELEELFLSRDEIPIGEDNPGSFIVPVHKEIYKLPNKIKNDTKIAWNVYPRVKEMFYEDMNNYLNLLDDEDREYMEKIYMKPKEFRYDSNFFPFPQNKEFTSYGAMCPQNRNIIAVFHIDAHVDIGPERVRLMPTNLVGEKFKEYCIEGTFRHNTSEVPKQLRKDIEYVIENDRIIIDKGKPWVKIFDTSGGKLNDYHGEAICYTTHNVEIYPDAFLLRDWAICYLNKLLEMKKK